ncbi:LacI family DNA-binding transcriptional regulator [Paenibacillus sp. FSL R5-0527]|uniref:LacI family DNA-binding transcriptional regulator n=1 Tax=Paenibacillus TaxID=44249 RepID=UPI000979EB2B|nr:LacI family DNA-binding transcriptional regulator [Paenibacillus macerans]MED4953715.1 LacI family DNA-binding transcriptional regulator [Paenibacillus macerans]OMG50697.1 LacI family transcriptional regulator [Paenibacillus macerans]
MKKLTIDDVARRAGVSKSTISQYLNQRYKYMSEATRQRIAEVIEELDYRPNGLARSLKQNRTHLVGIIVADIDYTLSIQCVRAIESELQNRGIQVLICNADENPEKEQLYIETLIARQVDGLIVFPTGHQSSAYSRLGELEMPFVFIDRLVDGVSTQSLLLDNEIAAKMGVEELVHHGHNRIGMMTLPLGEQGITPRKERLGGFRKAMEEAGLPLREEYLVSAPAQEIGARLSELMALPEPPTSLIAGNDIVLAELLKASNRLGISIPERLSVIGIDDADFARIYNPVITTICQPAHEMGVQAAKVILSGIEDRDRPIPITYRFPPALRQGESVKKLEIR